MTFTVESAQLKPNRLPLIPTYPPFRQWKPEALETALQDQPICIYVHIPFCTQRCAFCYYKTVDLKEGRPEVERYVNALCREFKLVAERFVLHERPIHAVYFGGGTPTVLQEHQFVKIVESLRENFKHFDRKQQFCVEAEPLTVSKSKMEILTQLGVNRLSMGVQSFDNEIIKLSGRGHDENQAYRAINIAQQAGDWSINIDLLSGLVGETNATWQKSVERALNTEVESITVYKMEAFANTDVYKLSTQQETVQLPSDEQELQFMQYAMEQFEQANYLPWSFFTYTKNGSDRSEYIANIWRGMEFYGFGVSAFGCRENSILQNTSDLEKYAATIATNELPLTRGYNLTSLDRMVREVLMGLKLLRLDLQKFKKQYGFSLKALCSSTLHSLEQAELITTSDQELALTAKGILYGDYVGQTLADALRKLH